MGRPLRAEDYPLEDADFEAVVDATARIEGDDGVTIPEIRTQVLLHHSTQRMWRMDEARGAVWVRHVLMELKDLGCVVQVDRERWQTG